MHLTETELQTLADGELLGRRRERAERHLAHCATCVTAVARLQANERWVADALRAVDHKPPAVSAERLMPYAVARRWRRWQALAAGIGALLVAAAGAAAVIPNSPLRAFLGLAKRTAHASRTAPQAPELSSSSVGFAPAKVVNVTFLSPQPSGEIGIVLADVPMVRVAHRGGSASYTLTADGVLIANEGSHASYSVTVPRAAPVVRIRVGGEVVFTREGGRVAAVAAPDQTGRYLIQFATLGREKN
ncbi:MAG TPA: zf-HC2 domain-containing protein [Gemmatimonadales bacterium]|nr:zf-HC2 domain-containing protein [Gemmatimonadales bacterium]